MSLISCKNASFGYDGNIVLEDVNFEINDGDYLCIIGENGSGKSTLIKGLLKLKTPAKGEITMCDDLKANEIGYLPQQTAAQRDFPASVLEVVLSGKINNMGIRPFYNKKEKEDAMEKLRLMNMDSYAKHSYQELSGGQQQRVLLARALCATKKILLLDEPANGLDPIVTNDLCKLIHNINKKLGITIIMVSHDIHTAAMFATHILHLGKKQLFFGKTEDYLKSDLGKKYTACIHTMHHH